MRTRASEFGLHVERLVGRSRIYADANVPAGVIARMRNHLDWDVLAVIEHDDLRRANDEEHYRLARQLQRTLVSLDRDYFNESSFSAADSGGVIVVEAPKERGLAKLLSKIDRAYFRVRGATARRSKDRGPPGLVRSDRVGPAAHAPPSAIMEPGSGATTYRSSRLAV